MPLMMQSNSGLHSHSIRLAKQDSIDSLQTKLRQQFRQRTPPLSHLLLVQWHTSTSHAHAAAAASAAAVGGSFCIHAFLAKKVEPGCEIESCAAFYISLSAVLCITVQQWVQQVQGTCFWT